MKVASAAVSFPSSRSTRPTAKVALHSSEVCRFSEDRKIGIVEDPRYYDLLGYHCPVQGKLCLKLRYEFGEHRSRLRQSVQVDKAPAQVHHYNGVLRVTSSSFEIMECLVVVICRVVTIPGIVLQAHNKILLRGVSCRRLSYASLFHPVTCSISDAFVEVGLLREMRRLQIRCFFLVIYSLYGYQTDIAEFLETA